MANRKIEAEFSVDLIDGLVGVPLKRSGQLEKVQVSVPAGAVAGAAVGTAVLPGVGTALGARIGAALGKVFGAAPAGAKKTPRHPKNTLKSPAQGTRGVKNHQKPSVNLALLIFASCRSTQTLPMSHHLPSSVTSTSLEHALDQNEAIQDTVEQSAAELFVINTVLKQEVPEHVQTGEVAQALRKTDELESRIQSSADDLAQVNEALKREICERAELEHQLASAQAALDQVQAQAPGHNPSSWSGMSIQ